MSGSNSRLPGHLRLSIDLRRRLEALSFVQQYCPNNECFRSHDLLMMVDMRSTYTMRHVNTDPKAGCPAVWDELLAYTLGNSSS